MNMQIHHDGEYPFDQVWICSKDHKHSVWKRVTNISEGKAKALLGMKEDQYLLNKGYVVYHSGPTTPWLSTAMTAATSSCELRWNR